MWSFSFTGKRLSFKSVGEAEVLGARSWFNCWSRQVDSGIYIYIYVYVSHMYICICMEFIYIYIDKLYIYLVKKTRQHPVPLSWRPWVRG